MARESRASGRRNVAERLGGNRVGGPTEQTVELPRIVNERNDVEKTKGEPTPVDRFVRPHCFRVPGHPYCLRFPKKQIEFLQS